MKNSASLKQTGSSRNARRPFGLMGAGSNRHTDINTSPDVQQAQSYINGHGFESQYITYFKNSNQQQSSTVEQFTRITSGRGGRDVTFILKTPYDDCRL